MTQKGGLIMAHQVYTIGREFGSMGLLVGQKLAERLGIKYYDKELLQQAAKDSGFCVKSLKITTKKQLAVFYIL